MTNATKRRKDQVHVWLLERNPLAAYYLDSILKGDGQIKVVGKGDISLCLDSASNRAMIIADTESLSSQLRRFLAELKAKIPAPRVLLIWSIAKAEDLYELLLLGIQGFIPYSEVDGGLVRAVKTIGAGHLWANAEVLEQFALYASRLSQSRRPGPSTLTRREGVVVDLLQQRLSNKEIGAALNITERTVRFHLGNVFSKLGVHDRYSLAELAKSSKLFKSGGDTKDFRKPPD